MKKLNVERLPETGWCWVDGTNYTQYNEYNESYGEGAAPDNENDSEETGANIEEFDEKIEGGEFNEYAADYNNENAYGDNNQYGYDDNNYDPGY